MEAIVGDLTSRGYGAVLWEPDDKTVRDARVTRFMTWLAGRGILNPGGYQDLWHWSVTDPAAFWSAVWDYFGVLGDRGDEPSAGRPGHAGRPMVRRCHAELRP